MSWVRLDDKRHQNPKLRKAGLAASGLDAYALTYCAANETDGFLELEIVSMLAGVRGWRKLADTLVEVGRWDFDQERQGYWIHDYLEFNFSKDEIAARDAKRSKAASKAARARWSDKDASTHNERIEDASQAQCDSHAILCPEPEPVPRVNYVNSFNADLEKSAAPKKRRKTECPKDFEVTPEMREWAKLQGVFVDLDDETQAFLDDRRAKGITYVDWKLAWMTWMRNSKKFSKPEEPPKGMAAVREVRSNIQRERERQKLIEDAQSYQFGAAPKAIGQ